MKSYIAISMAEPSPVTKPVEKVKAFAGKSKAILGWKFTRPLATIQSITGHESLSALERYIQREIAVTPLQTYEAQTDFARFILGLAAKQGQNPS